MTKQEVIWTLLEDIVSNPGGSRCFKVADMYWDILHEDGDIGHLPMGLTIFSGYRPEDEK